jgi:hypothetical protein
MTASTRVLALLLPALLLAGCAAGQASGGGSQGASTGGGAGGSAGPNCSGIDDPDYKLFAEPRLKIEPDLKVYPLGAKSSISFTDTDPNALAAYTTYSYSSSYISKGKVFPNDAAIFVGAEKTGTFSLDGPQSPSGVDGGPYAGFIDIEATTSAGTTVIARLCVAFAKG